MARRVPPPSSRGIVVGLKVDPVKVERAKQLGRQMTKAETVLWQRLRANRLLGLQFRRQQVIDGFIVDFYCHAMGLVLEIDGGVHAEQAVYDRQRDQVLTAHGLRVMRFTNDEIAHNLPSVLSRIEDWIRGRS